MIKAISKKTTQIETAARNRRIKQLAKDGKTADEITEIIGIKRYRVMQILRAYKIKAVRPSNKLHCEMAQNIVNELKTGSRQVDIAKKFNVSRQYVNQVRKIYLQMEQTNEK